MKKLMYWRILTLSMLLTFLGGTFALAAKPAPYVPPRGLSYKQVFYALKAMPANKVERVEFFKEAQRNLGLNEDQLEQKIESGEVRAEVCGENCSLKTAGLQNGDSVYWRKVKGNETVVYVYINNEWRPWFLVRCGNPVTDGKPVLYVKKDCCWQTGPPIVLESADLGGGMIISSFGNGYGNVYGASWSAPRFVSIFTPIACSGENFNQQ